MKSVIIGLGAISATHIKAIESGSFTELCGVCDIKQERVDAALDKIQNKECRGYTDYKCMIDEIKPDVVHICTPHYLHKEMTIYALKSACHVYLEKPAAMNADEAREMLAVSERTGRRVCVSFQNRVILTNATAKKYVEDKTLGKLMGVRGFMAWERSGDYYTKSGWRGAWTTEGGGVLMNQSIHTLDMMYYLAGKPIDVKGTVALRKNEGTIEVEDTAEATLWFENGVTGIFYATNCNVKDSSVQVEVFFEKGSLLIMNDRLYKTENGKTELVVVNSDYTKTTGKGVWGNGHTIMMEAFYSELSGNPMYYCTLEDAIPVLEIIEKIYETSPTKLR